MVQKIHSSALLDRMIMMLLDLIHKASTNDWLC